MSIVAKIAKLIADGKTTEADELIKSHTEKEVSGLKAKNEELLGSIKKSKEDQTALEKRIGSIEADKLKAEEDAVNKSGDVDKIREQLETRHKKEVDALKATNEKLDGQLNTHVIGEGLTAALIKAKVSPGLMPAAKALINSSFKGEVGDNDGSPFAKFDGQAVGDFVTSWAQTESGKHFVTADSNSGGGSNGANGSGKASDGNKKTMTRSEFNELPAVGRMNASKEGVTLTDE